MTSSTPYIDYILHHMAVVTPDKELEEVYEGKIPQLGLYIACCWSKQECLDELRKLMEVAKIEEKMAASPSERERIGIITLEPKEASPPPNPTD